MSKRLSKAFSLVELLIVLAMMGILAAFTIPMLVGDQASGNTKKTAMARDAALMIFNAYRQYKMSVGTVVPASMDEDSLTPYMNYASIVPTGTFDGSDDCSDGNIMCFRLHNGGSLLAVRGCQFAGQSLPNAVWYLFDPDSLGAPNVNSSLLLVLYYTGEIRTQATMYANSNLCVSPGFNPSADPPWFLGL